MPGVFRPSPNLVLILLTIVFAIFAMTDTIIEPGAVRTANKPDQFDTERALARISRLLGGDPSDHIPHPVDSPANKAVKARLMNEIQELGYEPALTTHTTCRDNVDQLADSSDDTSVFVICTTVDNISFQIGPASDQDTKDTLLLLSHYDSVPAGPGAGDAMIGVGTILEIAHHLKSAPVKRPVLVLLTDGEEIGLMGARAFLEKDPRARSIDMVLNFEARGVDGPALMFETSQPNGRVIPGFIKASRNASANSMMAAIYERMPNGTDLTEFIDTGIDGLNFAIIGNPRFYHTPGDNLENLSRRSLQHMGDLGLANTWQFLSDTNPKVSGNILYSDILGFGMIAIPEWAALPIAIIGFILAAIGLARFSSDENPIWGRINSLLLPLGALIIAAAITFMLQLIISTIRGSDYWIAHSWATLCFSILSAFLAIFLSSRIFGAQPSRMQIFCGCWGIFSLLGMTITVLLPGGAILFVAPLFLFSIAILAIIAYSPAGLIAEALAAIISIALWAPLISLYGSALGYGFSAAISILTVIALMPLIAFIAKPHPRSLEGHTSSRTALRLPILALSGATLLFAIGAILLPKFSEQAPQHLNITTYTDHDNGVSFTAFFTRGPNNPAPPKSLFNAGPVQPPAALISDSQSLFWHAVAPYQPHFMPAITLASRADPTIFDQPGTTIELEMAVNDLGYYDIRIPESANIRAISFGDEIINIPSSMAARPWFFRCFGERCPQTTTQFLSTMEKGIAPDVWVFYVRRYGHSDHAAPYVAARTAQTVAVQNGDTQVDIHRISPFIAAVN